jgi:hypothetical protein
VTCALDQIRAEQLLDVCHHHGITGGMQPVTSVVDTLPGNLEAACVAPYDVPLLDNGDRRFPILSQPECGTDACGSRTEDDDAPFTHSRAYSSTDG